MESFYFEPFKITDKRLKLNEHKIDSYNLFEFILLSTTPKRIARIFNELIEEGVLEIDENNEYEVEAIIDDAEENGEKQYLVKWKNWHIEFCTWEPRKNLKNCKQQFLLYERRKKDQTHILEEYTQPKLELIRQVMSILTECHVEYKHVQKYMTSASSQKAVKKHSSDSLLFSNKKRKKIAIVTLKSSLEEWQTLINDTYPLLNVRVENNKDNEGPPLDFEFITDYVSNSVVIHHDPPIGCNCGSKCLSNKDCGDLHGSSPPYTANGLIRVPPGVPVYECNKACSCNISCPFRVVQRGVKMDLTIFRTANRGWGLKTRSAIKKGSFMLEYLGEVLTCDEAEERGALYDQQNLTYLFDLDFAGDPEFTVDAYKKGNLAHFINHSCAPNMTSRCVFINCLDIRLPRIAFFAARDIKVDEELSFDYMMTGAINDDSDLVKENAETISTVSLSDSLKLKSVNSDIVSTSSITMHSKDEGASESASVINSVQMPKRVICLCKAKNCRKYLY